MATQTKRGSLAEQFITSRRKIEDNENTLNTYLKFDKVARHVADWECKGGELQKTKFVQSRMEQYRKRMEQELENRNQRVKELYDEEHEKYQVELRELR